MKRSVLFIALLLIATLLQAQSYKVIVNSSNPEASISASDLSKYFLKKTTKWANGEKVIPIDQSASSAVRGDFSKAALGKSVSAIKSYWQQYVFSGSGTPPIEKGSDAEVIEFVKNNAGAIGYISSTTNTNEVKVITVN